MKTRGQGPATPPANIVAAAHSPTKKTPGAKPAKTPAPLRRLLSTRTAEALEAGTLDLEGDGDGDDDDGVRPVDDDEPTLGHHDDDDDDDEEEEEEEGGSDDESDSEASSSEDDSDSDDDDDDDEPPPPPSEHNPYDDMNEATALYFAQSLAVHALNAECIELDARGELYANDEERREHERKNWKAWARHKCKEAAIDKAEELGCTPEAVLMTWGVKKSNDKHANAHNSLFGGHMVGGDMIEPLPAANPERGAAMMALPDEKRRDGLAKPSERKGKGGKGGKLRRDDPSAQGGVRAMRDLAATGAGLFVAPLDASRLRREAKKMGGLGAGNAGVGWFNMPAVEYTPELRRDMRLLKLRGAYDPKRFYKTDDTSKLPKHFQIGTVVEGAADFYSARMTKKERKRTLAEEIASNPEITAARKKRFKKLQEESANTLGRKHKRQLGGRQRWKKESTRRKKH